MVAIGSAWATTLTTMTAGIGHGGQPGQGGLDGHSRLLTGVVFYRSRNSSTGAMMHSVNRAVVIATLAGLTIAAPAHAQYSYQPPPQPYAPDFQQQQQEQYERQQQYRQQQFQQEQQRYMPQPQSQPCLLNFGLRPPGC